MKSYRFVLLSLLSGLLTSSALAQGTAVATKEKVKSVDPSGTWRWEYDWQGETRKDALMLDLEKDGKVTGTYVGNGTNKIEIRNGKIEGDKLALEVPFDYQGTEYLVPFSGKITKDEVEGIVVLGEQEYPWSPTRSVQMDDVLGTWQFEIETPDGNVLRPTLKISKDDAGKKLVGEYTSQQGYELNVETLVIKENNLLVTITAEYQGSDLRVDYKGRAYGDKMKGTLGYDFGGNAGEGEFIAKRNSEQKDK